MEADRIRQVVFVLDKNNYKFDVNQTITIKSLKKMIVSAANLMKSGLRVFHKGVEYTENEDSSLQDLFPNLQVVELTIVVDPEYLAERERLRQRESNIIVKLGEYCHKHEHKYPYFYCYECKVSFCSICMQIGDHKNHEYLEKYDYLQSSRSLVDSIFPDLKDFLHGTKFDEKPVEELKKKIKAVFFPQLTDMVQKIEQRLTDLIDFYFDNEKASFGNLQKNVNLLKTHCTEGLDKLKQEITIEDMMVNPKVFLIFDEKFKEIANEKSRIMKDSQTFEELRKNLSTVANVVDTVYTDIHNFLDKYLKSNVYTEIKSKISLNSIGIVNKEDIMNKLLSGVKKANLARVFSGSKTGETPDKSGVLGGFKLNFESSHKNVVPPILSEVPAVTPKSTKSSHGKGIVVAQIVPNTKEVILYDNVTNSITHQALAFNPILGLTNFLPNSAVLNVDGKLYVSGGLNKGLASNLFLLYNYVTNVITRLPDMLEDRHSHSMFHHQDFIYVVGPQNTTEKFDVKNQKWIKLSNLVYDERMNPILYVQNNFLYAFFGHSKGNYLDTVERLNLKTPKAKWELVPYKNDQKVDLKMSGAGIIPNRENESEIFLFGGKSKDLIRNSAVKFDFTHNTFDKLDIKLDEGVYYQESLLIDLGDNHYGHFNLARNEHFYKIQLG